MNQHITDYQLKALDMVFTALDVPRKHSNKHIFNRTHSRSLYVRGGMDKYYGRPAKPHWCPHDATGTHPQIPARTQKEIDEYMAGYEDCDDQKDWGQPE